MVFNQEKIEELKLNRIMQTGFVDMLISSFERSSSATEECLSSYQQIENLLKTAKGLDNTVEYEDKIDNILSQVDNVKIELKSALETCQSSKSSSKSVQSVLIDNYELLLDVSDKSDSDELSKIEGNSKEINQELSQYIKKMESLEMGHKFAELKTKSDIISEDSLLSLLSEKQVIENEELSELLARSIKFTDEAFAQLEIADTSEKVIIELVNMIKSVEE